MLTKSNLLAYRQCPRRLWLELHQPNAKAVAPQTLARYKAGEQVGAIARQHYVPHQTGHLIDPQQGGIAQALAQSQYCLQAGDAPVFEMGFKAAGALAFADVMLPVQASDGSRQWRMVEVKSTTGVKPYHQDDIAIQAYIARQAGAPLLSVALAHIDSSWTYPGSGDYAGLLTEVDLTDVTIEKGAAVADWIGAAAQIAIESTEPTRATGSHCTEPFECGFLAHCRQGEANYPQPIHWLPRLGAEKQAQWHQAGIHQLADVPDDWLNAIQQRVKRCTLANEPYFDSAGAAVTGGEEPRKYGGIG